LVIAALVALSTTADADWPMARHDPRRTGATTGTSNLRTPLPYWRQYLGGSLGTTSVIPLGDDAVAYVGAGRVRVLSSAGIVRWSSDNLALSQLVGTADLNRDGEPELVARSTDRVFVFDLESGAMRWAEPVGEMGTIADVRLAELDHLAGPELIVQECGCCQIRSGIPGAVYHFAADWTPSRLWQLPTASCGGARQMLAADLDGDGRAELVQSTHRDLRLVDGASGNVFATSPDLGVWAELSYCEAHDVRPGGGDELVCVQGSQLAAGHGHRAFVLAFAANPDRLVVVWSTDIGARDADFVLGAGHIVDLDRDGTLELTVTGLAADGTPLTVVLDAATGASLATIAGQETVGTVPATATQSIFITQASQQLLGWRFDRAAEPRLSLAWRLKDRRALLQRDWTLSPTQLLANRLIYADINGDGALDLFTVDTKRPDELPVYDALDPADTTLRTWKARPGSEIIAGWLDGDRLVVSSSDGRLTTASSDLTTTRGSFRAGQYYDGGGWLHLPFAPVAAQLVGDASAEIVIADSRRALLALDAKGATNAAPPRQLWELRSATAPAISPRLGVGGPGLVCRRLDTSTVPATDRVARVDGNGAVRWEMPIGGSIFNDVVLGNFDGDGIDDLVVQWGLTSDNAVRTTALAGSDGHTLWTSSTTGGEARFPSGAAVADWNHDGLDDVVFHHFGTFVLSGLDGAQLARGGPAFAPYFLPTLVDVDGDGELELTLSGGINATRTMAHDLTTTVWAGDDDQPYPYAALAQCSGRPLAVTTSLGHRARLRVVEQRGASVGQGATIVLAGGQRFADEAAATAAGVALGQLTSVHVHANLTGAGRPSAVVGSSDGWLYAVDPCTRTLDFAVPFGAPVGAVAFADIDADGLDDLLVSVADGYLYGLRNAPLAGPGLVRDLDPDATTGDDVDELTTRSTLAASWDPVAGAASYEVAIAHADGGYLLDPPWQPSAGTSSTQTNLPLEDGERYLVAVRALTASGGRSPDVLSDGVLVHVPPSDGDGVLDGGLDSGTGATGDPAGGCCSTGSRPGPALVLGASALALLLRRRRR